MQAGLNTGPMLAWALLFFAGLLEVVWAVGLRLTNGFTRPLPTLVTVLALGASLWLLSLASRTIPLGTAYAVWCAVGIVGTSAVGAIWLGEAVTAAKLACLALILAGVVGLKLIG